MHALLLVFALFCSITFSFAQDTCVPPCSIPDLGYCSSIAYPLYPVGLDVAKSQSELQGVFALSSFLEPTCQLALRIFACVTVYPSCTVDNSTVIPVRPCLDLCQNVHTACKDYIDKGAFAAYMSIINCSGVLPDGTPSLSSDPSQCASIESLTPNPACPQYSNSTNSNPNNTNVAGECQKYNSSLTPNTAELCSPYVSDQIFLPKDPSAQTELDKAIVNTTSLFMKFYPMLPIRCFRMLASMLCQITFPSCVQVNSTYQDKDPHCYSFCQEAHETCADVFSLLGPEYTSLYSCDMTHPITSEKLFPKEGRCNNDMIPLNGYSDASKLPPLPPFVCPSVMGEKGNPAEDDPQCAYPCPDKSFSTSQRKAMVYMMFFTSLVSFICMLTLGTSQVMIAEKRAFPASYTIWICFVTALMSLCYLCGGLAPQEDVWCVDKGTYSTQSNNTTCAVQAFLFIYFGLVIGCILCVLSCTFFAVIVLGKKTSQIAKNEKYTHIFIWCFPAIFTIGLIGKGMLGYMPILPLCFIISVDFTAPTSQDLGWTMDWPLFFLPLGLISIITLFMLVATEVKILFVQKLVHHGTTTAAQRRVITYVASIAVIMVIVLEWRIQLQSELQGIQHNMVSWYQCKLKTELGIADPGHCPSETAPTGIHYAHLFVVVFLPPAFGVIIFCIFGFDKTNYPGWILLFQTIFKTKKYDELWRFLRNGSTTSWVSYKPNYSSTSKVSSGLSNSNNSVNDFSTREIELHSSVSELTHENVNVELGTPPEDSFDQTGISAE